MNLTDLMKSIVNTNAVEEVEKKESEENKSILETYSFLIKDIEKTEALINLDDNLLLVSFLDKVDLSIFDIYVLNYLIYLDRNNLNLFFDLKDLDLEKEYLNIPLEVYNALSEKLTSENFYKTSDIKLYIKKEVSNLNNFINRSNSGQSVQSVAVSRLLDATSFKPKTEENKNIFI